MIPTRADAPSFRDCDVLQVVGSAPNRLRDGLSSSDLWRGTGSCCCTLQDGRGDACGEAGVLQPGLARRPDGGGRVDPLSRRACFARPGPTPSIRLSGPATPESEADAVFDPGLDADSPGWRPGRSRTATRKAPEGRRAAGRHCVG
ncbi:MAG: hypothetical protein U5K37_12945 [Natrialbaceae archaeon]|nr:hypothetical protein [Natrialbaceae archaeon]